MESAGLDLHKSFCQIKICTKKVVLAHPLKTEMIAEAKIKTDKIDAKTLAELL
jgi:hypothetical protein